MTDKTDEYEGWANRETWCVNLWLNNEAEYWTRCREIVAECKRSIDAPWQHFAAQKLEEYTGDLVDRASDALAGNGHGDRMGCDLMRVALVRVDWRAIAEGFGED